MDLAHFLGSIGTKVDAAVVRDVIRNTLSKPAASPSDLIEALTLKLHPGGARVVVDRTDPGDGGAAGKVVAFLVEQGEIRIEGRRVIATAKFPGK